MKKMVVLAHIDGVSGIVAPLCQALARHWEIVTTIDPYGVPLLKKWSYILGSFSMNRGQWRHEYHDRMDAYNRTPLAFRQRVDLCKERLSQLEREYDVVFQLSCMFLGSDGKRTKPYVVYLDRTIAMAQRYFPSMLRSMGPQEVEELGRMTREVLHTVDCVFTFNDAARDSVINDYSVHCAKVVNVGSGVNTPVPLDLEKKHSDVVLAVCSDFKRHNGQLSMDAFRIAQNRMPEARFIFVGDNMGEKPTGMEVFPFMAYEDLVKLYTQASIVLMPSLLGGMQTITEAMAHQCVCIANTENPYIRGLLIDKKDGFLFSGDDPRGVANMIVAVLKDRNVMSSIGHKAMEHILAEFTWPQVASKISHHIEGLVYHTDSGEKYLDVDDVSSRSRLPVGPRRPRARS